MKRFLSLACMTTCVLAATDAGAWTAGILGTPVGAEFGRGHEDLVKNAVLLANEMLAADYGEHGTAFFPPVGNEFWYGETTDSCETSVGNALLRGNCATDAPDDMMRTYYGRTSDADLNHDGELQRLHFTRNWVGVRGAESALSACVRGKETIIAATAHALRSYTPYPIDNFFYFVGHATHTIQDSFSNSHTRRTGDHLRTLTDVCTYDRAVSGACEHEGLESIYFDDRIWQVTTNPFSREMSAMKPLAREAIWATAGYLHAVGRLARHLGATATEADVRAVLQPYFDDPDSDPGYSGYFDCTSLNPYIRHFTFHGQVIP